MDIYVVDDEEDLRNSLAAMLGQGKDRVQTFASGQAFLASADELPAGCVLLDLCLPDIDGLKVQHELAERGYRHSIVLFSGYGDIPDAVSAMRAGAVDFLRKPYRRAELFEALDRARARLSATEADTSTTSILDRFSRLTQREREVIAASGDGTSAKQVAFDLGLSVRTIEMYRSSILKKLEVDNFTKALLAARTVELGRAQDGSQIE